MGGASGGDSFLDYFDYSWVDGLGDVEVEVAERLLRDRALARYIGFFWLRPLDKMQNDSLKESYVEIFKIWKKLHGYLSRWKH